MRVFVAMSGGVDSSVAAALMVRAGHDVTGVTMELLPGPAGRDAVRSARRVCDALSVPHVVLDCASVFEEEVIGSFASEYAAGRTPNPCITCNERVKFPELLVQAEAMGGEALATGHYARVERDGAGTAWLTRGADPDKDQSYFLYRLAPSTLERVLFPVGDMDKAGVRDIARSLGLPSAERPDSQEVCFVADGAHAELVAAYCPEASSPGEIVDLEGRVRGTHRGLARYTVGQRKGLGIAAPEPLYVVALDPVRNRVVVSDRTRLSVNEIEASNALWRLGTGETPVEVQTRYRMKPVRATARFADGSLVVRPVEPVAAVAPGQAVVCYSHERVIGGGPVLCVR